MATIEKRGDGSWRITVSGGYGPDGKQIRVRRTFRSDPNTTANSQRKQAEKYAAALETDFERQQVSDAKKLTFKTVFDDYIQDRIKRRGLVQSTADSYQKLFDRKLLPHFGKRAIRDITPRDLNAFFRKLDKEDLSGTYQRKFYQQLNELFRYAQRTGIIITNPCNLIELPKIDTPEAQYYDISECPDILKKIKEYQHPEWRAYFSLQFYCGSRPEEMTGLNWSDFDGSVITISAGAYQAKGEKCKRTERPKTKKSNRKIQLPPDAIEALELWKKEQDNMKQFAGNAWADPDAVFTNYKGERISLQTPSKRWKSFTTENKIRHLPLYSLRHTNCSLLISSKELSVEEVAARMGHEQTSTTLNIYSHCFDQANERATSAITNILDKEIEKQSKPQNKPQGP